LFRFVCREASVEERVLSLGPAWPQAEIRTQRGRRWGGGFAGRPPPPPPFHGPSLIFPLLNSQPWQNGHVQNLIVDAVDGAAAWHRDFFLSFFPANAGTAQQVTSVLQGTAHFRPWQGVPGGRGERANGRRSGAASGLDRRPSGPRPRPGTHACARLSSFLALAGQPFQVENKLSFLLGLAEKRTNARRGQYREISVELQSR
jgi:hypothetical protein